MKIPPRCVISGEVISMTFHRATWEPPTPEFIIVSTGGIENAYAIKLWTEEGSLLIMNHRWRVHKVTPNVIVLRCNEESNIITVKNFKFTESEELLDMLESDDQESRILAFDMIHKGL